MTRIDLMKAMVAIYGSRQAVADAIGMCRTMVGQIERGHRSMTDETAQKMIAALCDRAGEADKLANAIDTHIKARSLWSRRGQGPRDERGMFV